MYACVKVEHCKKLSTFWLAVFYVTFYLTSKPTIHSESPSLNKRTWLISLHACFVLPSPLLCCGKMFGRVVLCDALLWGGPSLCVPSCSPQHQYLTEALHWRAQTDPDHVLFVLLNAKVILIIMIHCVLKRKKTMSFHLTNRVFFSLSTRGWQ